MGLNHAVAGIPQTGPRLQDKSPQRDECAFENELENRIENLNKLLLSVQKALEQQSFSGKEHAIGIVTDLRMKIKASHEMFRVGKLVREPARESMLSKVRDCVNGLEEVVASQLGVKMN